MHSPVWVHARVSVSNESWGSVWCGVGGGHRGRRAAMEQRCERMRVRVHPCINDDGARH